MFDWKLITHLPYRLFKAKPSGLLKDKPDERDFNVGIFGWGDYKPKNQRKIIKTVSVKNQGGFNTCFPGSEKVLYEDFSYRDISSLVAGDKVFTHKGNIKTVTNVMKRVWQGNTYLLKLWGDFREIEATPEHPVLALKNNLKRKKQEEIITKENIDFYPIKDLTSSDWVAIPFNDIVRDTSIYSFETDPDFLWVLGLFLAEGSFRPSQVVFSLNKNETDFYYKVKSAMSKYGASVTYSFNNHNGLTVTINSKKWVNIFEELGGKYCDKKRLNNRLMFINPNLQINIYNGLKDGDGYDHKDGYNIIQITSYELLEQIRTILFRNKIYSLLRQCTKIDGKKQSWSLSVSKNSKYSYIKDGYILTKIKYNKKKSYYYGGNVYNIEVEDDNSYIVKGVAVHNCQWNATIVQKEVDEGIELSVRKFVTWGQRNGYISGDGFSNLRSGQIALQKYGAEPNTTTEEAYPFSVYANAALNLVEAEKHRTSSFWSVSSRNDIIKLLDEGHILTTGITWRTSYNQGGGFSAPWIIKDKAGYVVGGHAVAVIGYDLNYNGRKVYIIQNSYGINWGDSGKFYIDMTFLENDNYGIWVNLDTDVEVGKFLAQNDGKNVKGKGPAVYFIQQGKKKVYPDQISYLAYNPTDSDMKNISVVDDAIISKVESGDKMDIKKSYYWPFLESISTPARKDELKRLIGSGVLPK